MTTLPFFLISSGVIANADRVMSAGAASSAAPAEQDVAAIELQKFAVVHGLFLR